MAKYIVEVIISTCVEIEVEAHDEEEARNLAIEEADPFEINSWDYEVDCVYENEEEEEEEDEEEEEGEW